ncbi:MAG TPA: tetratricopeptide repeat protein [Longimicrobium sp.]|jgi:Flp pilus assembly protein TadD|uniref:tetratricopeptide repeat protein n=1 Tax=Longimicrobium sp. TaxID=2029185 RepID=UPI002ED940B4
MSWFTNLIGGRSGAPEERDPDYYEEGTVLLHQEKYHEALTSFRLALRESPNDTDVLQQIAVAYTRIGMTDEAVKTYRRVLELKPHASGAHYGLAFLLLQQGQQDGAVAHLRAFLARPPQVPNAARHVSHARATLAELTGEGEGSPELQLPL